MGKAEPIGIITGAAGGVGLASARLIGRRLPLLVTDIDPERTEATVRMLGHEGYQVEGVAGDLADAATIRQLVGRLRQLGRPRALVHAAGLSPALADWRRIIRANAIGTWRLLAGIEPLLQPGSTAVLVASVAGHLAPREPAIERLLQDPLAEGLLEALQPRFEALLVQHPGSMEGHAYSCSKRAIIDTCKARAAQWGQCGARIVTVSPGGMWTAMGRAESEHGARVNAVIKATPAGRWGTAIEVASAIEFLLSPLASYITGTDLLIDGGAAAALSGTTL